MNEEPPPRAQESASETEPGKPVQTSFPVVRCPIDAIAAHVAILDEGGRVLAINQSWRDFAAANQLLDPLCATGEDYVSVCRRVKGSNRETVKAAEEGIAAVLRGERREFGLEYPCYLSRERHWFRMRVTRFEEGAALRLVVIREDITQRKLAEEMLRKREAEMAHLSRLASVGEMAAGLAHEVNQPLAAIMNYAGVGLDLVRAMGDRSPLLVTVLREIAGESRRAVEIVRRVMGFVRKQEPTRRVVAIDDVVREAAKMMRFELDRNHVQPQMLFSDGLPAVLIDVVQVEQVLINLLRNALEAMHDTPASERRLVLGTALESDGTVRVSISDSGCGVSPEVREVLFDSFVTNKPNGLGLGLAISRSIIESHGGRLRAIDNQGRGTTFEFTLPAATRGSLHEPGECDGFRGGR
ncbi:MAG TPA: ATP-binding protein [Tepidisphaeraceae bacterium]|nr:ATP-binding protein [Tepidisphaeraceae bacterium]